MYVETLGGNCTLLRTLSLLRTLAPCFPPSNCSFMDPFKCRFKFRYRLPLRQWTNASSNSPLLFRGALVRLLRLHETACASLQATPGALVGLLKEFVALRHLPREVQHLLRLRLLICTRHEASPFSSPVDLLLIAPQDLHWVFLLEVLLLIQLLGDVLREPPVLALHPVRPLLALGGRGHDRLLARVLVYPRFAKHPAPGLFVSRLGPQLLRVERGGLESPHLVSPLCSSDVDKQQGPLG
mmetsp:Transcript_10297/g.19965  ORF Transcript_10297/g.19965 Transcript_10297/m.19965 type:complete len:240 (-) Transcript_10297:444-1163(-)